MIVVGEFGVPGAAGAIGILGAIYNGASIFIDKIAKISRYSVAVWCVASNCKSAAGKIDWVGAGVDGGSVIAIADSALEGASILQDYINIVGDSAGVGRGRRKRDGREGKRCGRADDLSFSKFFGLYYLFVSLLYHQICH